MVFKQIYKPFWINLLFSVLLITNNVESATALAHRAPAALKSTISKQPGLLVSLGALKMPEIGAYSQGAYNYQAKRVLSTEVLAGPIAKINLLKGQFVSARPTNDDHTLLHGAMLSELGMIKSLYTLLVSPKKIILDDGRTRLVPDCSFSPLGKLLQQLFYLAGGTLAPTKRNSSYAYNLTPEALGRLYKAIVDDQITIDFDPSNKKIGGGQAKKAEYEATRKLLMEALLACQDSTQTDMQKIYPAIIRAYFWAKFVINADTVAIAQANIDAFSQASGDLLDLVQIKEAHHKINSEDSCMHRLINMYRHDLPKPPIQGWVTLSKGLKFPDCGESGLRGFFNAAFYDQNSQSCVIPSEQIAWYDPKLVDFYLKYPTLAAQDIQEARNAWGEVISNRSGIIYGQGICDLDCRFSNVVNLMAKLMPGLCIDLDQSDSVNLFKQMVEKHRLKLVDFLIKKNENGQNEDAATWFITNGKELSCRLFYHTYRGHMQCELHTTQKYQQPGLIEDPILGCVDVLDDLPRKPECFTPYLFAAGRMAKQQDYTSSYLALYPDLGAEKLAVVTQNIQDWGLLTPQDRIDLNLLLHTPDQRLITAVKRGLNKTYNAIIREQELATESNDETSALVRTANQIDRALMAKIANNSNRDFNASKAILTAASADRIDICKLLIKNGANINHIDQHGHSLFELAAFYYQDQNLVKLLIESGVKFKNTNEKGNTLFHEAALSYNHGNWACKPWLIDLLVANGLDINAPNHRGETALHLICANSSANISSDEHDIRDNIIAIMKKLLEHGADTNATTSLYHGKTPLDYVEYGNARIKVKLLVEHGASVSQKQFDHQQGLGAQNAILDALLTKKLPTPDFKGRYYSLEQRLDDACLYGQFEVAKFMLELGAATCYYRYGIKREEDKINMLYLAALNGHLEIAKLLLDHGVDVEAGSYYSTPLQAVCGSLGKKDCVEMVKLLLDRGANLNLKTEWNTNLLQEACSSGNLEIAKILIERGIQYIPAPNYYSEPINDLLRQHQKPILERIQQTLVHSSLCAWGANVFNQFKSKFGF